MSKSFVYRLIQFHDYCISELIRREHRGKLDISTYTRKINQEYRVNISVCINLRELENIIEQSSVSTGKKPKAALDNVHKQLAIYQQNQEKLIQEIKGKFGAYTEAVYASDYIHSGTTTSATEFESSYVRIGVIPQDVKRQSTAYYTGIDTMRHGVDVITILYPILTSFETHLIVNVLQSIASCAIQLLQLQQLTSKDSPTANRFKQLTVFMLMDVIDQNGIGYSFKDPNPEIDTTKIFTGGSDRLLADITSSGTESLDPKIALQSNSQLGSIIMRPILALNLQSREYGQMRFKLDEQLLQDNHLRRQDMVKQHIGDRMHHILSQAAPTIHNPDIISNTENNRKEIKNNKVMIEYLLKFPFRPPAPTTHLPSPSYETTKRNIPYAILLCDFFQHRSSSVILNVRANLNILVRLKMNLVQEWTRSVALAFIKFKDDFVDMYKKGDSSNLGKKAKDIQEKADEKLKSIQNSAYITIYNNTKGAYEQYVAACKQTLLSIHDQEEQLSSEFSFSREITSELLKYNNGQDDKNFIKSYCTAGNEYGLYAYMERKSESKSSGTGVNTIGKWAYSWMRSKECIQMTQVIDQLSGAFLNKTTSSEILNAKAAWRQLSSSISGVVGDSYSNLNAEAYKYLKKFPNETTTVITAKDVKNIASKQAIYNLYQYFKNAENTNMSNHDAEAICTLFDFMQLIDYENEIRNPKKKER